MRSISRRPSTPTCSSGDVGQVSIAGLGGVVYVDKTDDMRRKTLAAGPLRLNGTTDRVFLSTRAPCTVTIRFLAGGSSSRKTGSSTTVVWNPWHEKASTMADLGDEQWRSMLCVEAANAADNAVHLEGGERHAMVSSSEPRPPEMGSRNRILDLLAGLSPQRLLKPPFGCLCR